MVWSQFPRTESDQNPDLNWYLAKVESLGLNDSNSGYFYVKYCAENDANRLKEECESDCQLVDAKCLKRATKCHVELDGLSCKAWQMPASIDKMVRRENANNLITSPRERFASVCVIDDAIHEGKPPPMVVQRWQIQCPGDKRRRLIDRFIRESIRCQSS